MSCNLFSTISFETVFQVMLRLSNVSKISIFKNGTACASSKAGPVESRINSILTQRFQVLHHSAPWLQLTSAYTLENNQWIQKAWFSFRCIIWSSAHQNRSRESFSHFHHFSAIRKVKSCGGIQLLLLMLRIQRERMIHKSLMSQYNEGLISVTLMVSSAYYMVVASAGQVCLWASRWTSYPFVSAKTRKQEETVTSLSKSCDPVFSAFLKNHDFYCFSKS